jgi:quercetin dioxygenase-like cupin family protein
MRSNVVPVTSAAVGKKSDAVFHMRGDDAPIVLIELRDGVPLPTPVDVKILMPGPKASLFEMLLPRNTVLPSHRYAQDSIYYLVSGAVKLEISGRVHEAHQRDAWAVAAGAGVAMEAIADSILLEWMSGPHLVAGSELISWGEVPSCGAHIFAQWREVQPFPIQRVEGETHITDARVDIDHQLRVMIPGPNGSLLWNAQTGMWASHTHHHNSVTYVIGGKMRNAGGQIEFTAGPGDIWAVQAGAEHLSEGVGDNEIVEFKWPAPMLWGGIIQSWEPHGHS